MRKGQDLYNRAKQVIPGGTMLLSKRPEMFLPDNWPAYYKRASGCHIWTLDDSKLLDMTIMGIGTNILGYGHPDVDNAVIDTVKNGNMSTLNCPEEVALAERLVSMHPWSDMVRFARSGGEANAIAIRIARAASGKDKVAICGYHGWHDWYLSVNLSSRRGLDGHLLPGLEPNGVPSNLEGTTLPFSYNRLEELRALFEQHDDLGVVKMEVSRNEGPEDGFLQGVRDLCDKHGAVLIFDECTSGFRETFGGLHLKYGVDPDIAMFGKAMGNGYAITAVLGRREVMEAAQKTFISSTFWTERVGPTAAVVALDVMENIKAWEVITEKGQFIKRRWHEIANRQHLSISISGLDALACFQLTDHPESWLNQKTFITQEMLKRGILASNSIYSTIAHKETDFVEYFENLEEVLMQLRNLLLEDSTLMDALDGPVCHSGFKRLN